MRFALLIILLLLSLLTVLRAPAYYLWMAAILVTELPWVFAGITLLLLLWPGIKHERYPVAVLITGILAFLLFLTPIVRAYKASEDLYPGLKKGLGPIKGASADKLPTPYGFWRSVFGHTEAVAPINLPYARYADTSLTLDFYTDQSNSKRSDAWVPTQDQPAPKTLPCVIVIHGGSWSGGDSNQITELNSYLTKRGYRVASINYRLAPKYQSPAPVEDVCAAMDYLRKHAKALGVDTSRFVLLGRSAGAQIAMLAAYKLHDPAIKGVIDFYGPADMVWGYSVPSSPLIMDSRKVMRNYIGGAYEQVPAKFAAASPLEFVSPQSPPTLLMHGPNDPLVAYEHSRRLDEKLEKAGVKHYWLQLPWATHGFDYIRNGPGGQLSRAAIDYFLKTVCH